MLFISRNKYKMQWGRYETTVPQLQVPHTGHKQRQWRVSSCGQIQALNQQLELTGSPQIWCEEKDFENGHSVSEMKLLAWIQEEFFGHPIEPRRGGKSASHLKSEDPAEDADEVTRTFAAATIEFYVSAIVSLYNEQTQHGMNSYPHPRTPLVADILASKKSEESKRRRVEYEDRGRGTLQEGYDQAQFSAMLRWCHTGSEKPVFLLRTGVDFLLAHHMLLRSEARRSMELADMFCLSLDNEIPTPCTALVVLLDHGKANKVSRVERCGIGIPKCACCSTCRRTSSACGRCSSDSRPISKGVQPGTM